MTARGGQDGMGVGWREEGAPWLGSMTGGHVRKWQLARPLEGWKEFLPGWRVGPSCGGWQGASDGR